MMPPVMLRRLLALDLRLLWRGSILLRTRRAVWVPLIATLVAFQAAAYGVAGIIIAHPLPRPQMLLAANVNLLLLSALMLSRAITVVVDMLYARADADFLFSTPVPAAAILASRMISAGLAVAAPWVLMAGVLGLGLALHGAFWGLAAAPLLLALGGLCAALAFAIVLALVGRVQPQTARRGGHSIALALGLGIFMLGQAQHLVPAARLRAFWNAMLPVPGTPAAWLAAALLGAPWPFVTGLGVLAGAAIGLWACLTRRFSAGALTAATHREVSGPASGVFPAGPLRALLARNVRLIWRFPGLISQTVYRALTLFVLGYLLAHPHLYAHTYGHAHAHAHARAHAQAQRRAIAPLLCFVTAQLALFFMSVLRAGDDAPALAGSAPIGPHAARLSAMAAAGLAALIVVAIPALATLLLVPSLSLAVLAGGAGAWLSALLLGYRLPMPVTRAAFGKPPVGTLMGLVCGTALASAWAALAWAASPS
jgi:ABC-2 type transport system permease protein